MKIAILAAGAVGGHFGARLAGAGHDVRFLARGAHLAACQKNGLKVASPLGDMIVPGDRFFADAGEIGEVDIILLAVKLWATEAAGMDAQALIGPETKLISLQNGVDSAARLGPIIGQDKVVNGIAAVSASIIGPGMIRHNAAMEGLTFGEVGGDHGAPLKAFAAACDAAGITTNLSDDILREIWSKFVFLVGLSGMTALTRQPIGVVRDDEDAARMLEQLMLETQRVGQASGVELPDDLARNAFHLTQSLSPRIKASMAVDLDNGSALELDWLSGKVVALGREFDVATPMNEAVYVALKPFRNIENTARA